jgi:FdhD protein
LTSSKLVKSNAPLDPIEIFKSDSLENSYQEFVAEETPVAMTFNGISHAVMMTTPQDLEDFAYGFSISEGLVKNIDDIFSIEINQVDQGIELNIEISSEAFMNLKDRRKNLAGRTGCGICGSESLSQIFIESENKILNNSLFDLNTIHSALEKFGDNQIIKNKTGSTHACSLFNNKGDILCTREDVGRHNALDKLIGFTLKTKINLDDTFLVISSRASFEMIQKASFIGCQLLVAISAPTALAVRLANNMNITLAGFAKNKVFNVYTHKNRLNV